MLSTAKPVAFIATADAARARVFYESVLGLRIVEDQPYALVVESAGTTIRVKLPTGSADWESSLPRSSGEAASASVSG